ncbi:MAG TPA: hypothetical protein VFI53_00325, partial [Myxococcaceae bacterium]|nr:hypothetical protein [Myxococcaceae bacterium]
PPGPGVAAGSLVRAQASVVENATLVRLSTRAVLGGVEIATGGAALEVTIPVDTPVGTPLVVTATALDGAGQPGSASATRTVVAPVQPGQPPGPPPPDFAGVTRLEVLGDSVAALGRGSLLVGQLQRAAGTVTFSGQYTPAVPPVDLAIEGRLVVLALGSGGLDLVDVMATPPVRLSHLDGTFTRVIEGGGSVYVQAGAMVRTLSLAAPATPVLSASLGQGQLLAARPDRPIIGSGPSASDGSRGVTIDVSKVRAAERDGDLWVFGTTDGLQIAVPSLITPISVPMPPVRALAVQGGLAQVACEDGVLRTVDLRDRSAPRLVDEQFVDATEVRTSGELLLTTEASGLQIRKLPGTSGAAVALGKVQLADGPSGVTPYGPGFLVAANTAGAVHVGVEDPLAPSILRPVTASATRAIEQRGGLAFVLGGSTVKAYQLQTIGPVTWVENTSWAPVFQDVSVERLALADGRVWTLGGGQVSTVATAAPAPLHSTLVQAGAADLDGDAEVAVLGLRGQGVAVLALDAAGDPQVIGTLASAPAERVALSGRTATVAMGSAVSVIDLSNPASPVLRGTYTAPGSVQRLRAEGALVLISEGNAGVELLDVSNAAQPVRIAGIPASQAVDARVSGPLLAVADAVQGLQLFSLPALAAAPVVGWIAPASGTEIAVGSMLDLRAALTGPLVDDAELWIEGAPLARVDDADARALISVSATATPGSTLGFRWKVRSADGAEAFSPERRFRVVAPAGSAPQVAISAPVAGTRVVSGGVVDLVAAVTAGVRPFSAFALVGDAVGGNLYESPSSAGALSGSVRAPVVSTDTSVSFTVVVTDGLGRVAQAVVPLTVAADVQAPTIAQGLPSVLRTLPAVNDFTIEARDDGDVTVRVELDGSLIASDSAPFSARAPVHIELPASSAGSTVSLRVVATDAAGRSVEASQSYVVQGSGNPPTVAFDASTPPSGIEGDTVVISATGSDPDGDLAEVVISAAGVEIARGPGPKVSGSLLVPLLSTANTVTLTATARDSQGHQTPVTRVLTVQANTLASISFSSDKPAYTVGDTARICATATDDVQVTALTLALDGQAIAASPTSCGAKCLTMCGTVVAATAGSISATATAMDQLNAQSTGSASFPVVTSTPPTITFNPAS